MKPFFIAESQDAIMAVTSNHWGGTGHSRMVTFYRLPDGRWAAESERFPEDMLREHASEVRDTLPEGAEPLQITSTWPTVPYAGNWIPLPGSDFGRSICRGNYRFGGSVQGEVEPVNLVLRLILNYASQGGDCSFQLCQRPGWRVVSPEYRITASGGGRRMERVLHKGDVFTASAECEAPIFSIEVAGPPLEPKSLVGPVDSLGRW